MPAQWCQIVSGEMPYTVYREIRGFPNYFVGTDGSVWSGRDHIGMPKAVWTRLSVYRRREGGRYCVITLRAARGGKVSHRYVHRLVLESFVGPCPLGMECCHKNAITNDNRLTNLRWDTKKNNDFDRWMLRSASSSRRPIGKTRGTSLWVYQVREIRKLKQVGYTTKQLCVLYGVNRTTIQKIAKGTSWKSVVD